MKPEVEIGAREHISSDPARDDLQAQPESPLAHPCDHAVRPSLQDISTTMASFKDPSFQDRTSSAAAAKQKALEALKAKPPIDEAVVAERLAAREAKELAEREKRAAKRAAEDEAKAVKKAEAEAAAAKKREAEAKVELTDAEKKAIRDAKYAARKNKKK
ncbi:DUF6481 family protein [Sphingomonas albertensis]|nr:DUF6481 family protein [Sphingomonas albertensis]